MSRERLNIVGPSQEDKASAQKTFEEAVSGQPQKPAWQKGAVGTFIRTTLAIPLMWLGANIVAPKAAEAAGNSDSTTTVDAQPQEDEVGRKVLFAETASQVDYPVIEALTNKEIGHFYTQTNEGQGTKGFLVVDDYEAPMWSVHQQFGGVNALGYPVSSRFKDELGRIVQVFQKAVIQLTVENGKLVKVEFMNTFDELEKRGINLDNPTDLLPKSFDWSTDSGKPWGSTKDGPLPGTIEENHFKVVFEGKIASDIAKNNPGAIEALRRAILANPLWLQMYGLPMSIKDYGPVIVVKGQRGAYQYWKDKTPWTTKPGEVVVVNGGDTGKKYVIFPASSLMPLENPLAHGGSSVFPESLGNWQIDWWELHNNGRKFGLTVRDAARLTQIFHELEKNSQGVIIKVYDPPGQQLPMESVVSIEPNGSKVTVSMHYITDENGEKIYLFKRGFWNLPPEAEYLRNERPYYFGVKNGPGAPNLGNGMIEDPSKPAIAAIVFSENFQKFPTDPVAMRWISIDITTSVSDYFLGGDGADAVRTKNWTISGAGVYDQTGPMLQVKWNP